MAEQIKVAFVGSGAMARAHAPNFDRIQDAQIGGFCDLDGDRAEAMAKEHGGKAFTDPAKMLDAVEPDGVYILLPPFAHGEAEFACLEREIPFFVEKPINLYLDQAQEIAQAVADSGLLTAAGYLNRYRTNMKKARQMLQDDPAVLAIGGWIGGSPDPSSGSSIIRWWIDKAKSGGQFTEQVTHTVDLVRFLMGEATEVAAVAAEGFNVGIPGYDIEDAWAVAIKFASGGVANLYACTASNARGGVTLDVYAKNCAFEFTGWEHNCKIYRVGEEEPEEVPGDEEVFYLEDVAFIEMLRSGDQSKVQSDYADSLKTLEISIAADQSVATGETIRL